MLPWLRAASIALALWGSPLLHAQGPDLVGYWHNWNDGNAPYLELTDVDPRYSIVNVAFGAPVSGTTHVMEFVPSYGTPQEFINDVAALQAQGRKVNISIGGANATIQLNSDDERDDFVYFMHSLLLTWGFDGLDIDLEGASVAISGGSIAAPTDQPIIRLIDAVRAIMAQYRESTGRKLFLSMAPETAYIQGGQSAYGGIWGAYLPIIDALRDSLDLLHVQLYNSGSMYGIDGGIYTQGTADFIVSQTEALLQGFQTNGGFFAALPPEKVAIGLPACPLAAGGGYVSPAVLEQAVDYLRGTGPQPGSYQRVATYPTLRGLMTWSINWDAVSTCASANEFAQAYADIFGLPTTVEAPAADGFVLWPVPVDAGLLHVDGLRAGDQLVLRDALGRTCAQFPITAPQHTFDLEVGSGTYMLQRLRAGHVIAASRLVVH
jgi:chitinase